MANSFTTRTRLKKPASNDKLWGSTAWNPNADQLDAVEAIGALAVKTLEQPSTTLNVAVSAGPYRKADGTIVSYAGSASFALTASATNRLYLTNAGVLTKDTTGFPAATDVVRLATVVTGTTTVTSVTDARVPHQSFGAAVAGAYLPLAGGTLTDGANVVVGSTTGTKLATATTQKLGLWNATPVVQPAGSTDVLASLVTIGARGASNNPPLNLGTGALTAGATTTTTLAPSGDVTLADGANIIVGDVTGTMIGTDPTQLLGFFGAGPVVQPSDADQSPPAGMTSQVISDSTTGTPIQDVLDVGATFDQALLNDNFASLVEQVNLLQQELAERDVLILALRTAMVNLGLIVGA